MHVYRKHLDLGPDSLLPLVLGLSPKLFPVLPIRICHYHCPLFQCTVCSAYSTSIQSPEHGFPSMKPRQSAEPTPSAHMSPSPSPLSPAFCSAETPGSRMLVAVRPRTVRGLAGSYRLNECLGTSSPTFGAVDAVNAGPPGLTRRLRLILGPHQGCTVRRKLWGVRVWLLHWASSAAEITASYDVLIPSHLREVALTRRPSTFSTSDRPSKYWRPLAMVD